MKTFHTLLLLFFTVSLIPSAGFSSEPEHRTKKNNKGWIGISVQDVTPKLAREKNLSLKEGAYVTDVANESPAEFAGIKEGDIITEFSGKKIELSDDLADVVQSTKPGTQKSLVLFRNGEKKTLQVTVGKNKSLRNFSYLKPFFRRFPFAENFSLEGMKLFKLEKQLGNYFEAPNGKGLLITDVEKESNSAKAGLQAGDVIIRVNNEEIADFEDLQEIIEDVHEGDKISVEYLRKEKKQSTTVEISDTQFSENNRYDFPSGVCKIICVNRIFHYNKCS
ncbi:MAG: PDZ domain-containing protein, partial [Bacteroidetes bacterium]|nr:PDZ domain-containing protein [Bacteroidota bacterium]